MIKAFVLGKFLPFHKGHEALIRFALRQCDFLSVLVCCSDNETIAGRIRKNWIIQTINEPDKMEVFIFNYIETDLPNKSETSFEVSKVWSCVLKELYPDYSLLITSEPYGNLVADFMKIKHISFDPDRGTVPVSGSQIGEDIFTNWNFMPDVVKQDFAVKVVISGTESTGKTTLANRLVRHYNCQLVAEAGRDLIPDSKEFSFDDLLMVAEAHSKRINVAVSGNSPLVILDTDVYTTISYSRFIFDRILTVSDLINNMNESDLCLYLNNDVAYFQDGTRLEEFKRNQLDHVHRQVLKEHGIKIIEIRGDWQIRFDKAVYEIDKLCNNRTRLQLR